MELVLDITLQISKLFYSKFLWFDPIMLITFPVVLLNHTHNHKWSKNPYQHGPKVSDLLNATFCLTFMWMISVDYSASCMLATHAVSFFYAGFSLHCPPLSHRSAIVQLLRPDTGQNSPREMWFIEQVYYAVNTQQNYSVKISLVPIKMCTRFMCLSSKHSQSWKL